MRSGSWRRRALGAALAACVCLAAGATAEALGARGPTVLDAKVEPCPLEAPTPGDTREDAGTFCDTGGRAEPRSRRHRRERRRRSRAAPPAAATPSPTPAEELPEGNPDPFRSLGAGSPFCHRRGLRARPGCRISGAIEHTYPISNYGLDVQIDTGVTKIEDNLYAALQSVASLCWLGLVYALKGVLLLLEWAFSLDLLNEAMRSVRHALDELHRSVLGTPWFMAAIALAGLWGIWHGLVQRRTGETIGGLAATVALMVAALVVINNPTGTVGHASKLANDASLGFMSAASTGTVRRPEDAFARGTERLFDTLVLRPWCALEFGDIRYCTRRRRGGYSNADLWLAFPADGKERQALYKLTKGQDPGGTGLLDHVKDAVGGVILHGPLGLSGALLELAKGGGGGSGRLPDSVKRLVRKDPDKVKLQEKGGTFTRISLLLLIALGLTGAICLLLYLAIKLVLAGLLSLMLLLLAPAMLLAPAFGYSGRLTFVAWGKRLVGAIAAKLIYSLLLALVVVAATTLASLDVGWFGTWLLQIAFWWGILIKRRELTGFLSGAHEEGRRWRPPATVRAYQHGTAVSGLAAGAAAAATLLPGRARSSAVAVGQARRQAEQRAVAQAAEEHLDRSALRGRELELADARSLVAARPEFDRRRRALDRELSAFERGRELALARGESPPQPTDEQQALIAKREELDRAIGSDRMRGAERLLAESDRARAREGRVMSTSELAAWREQRRLDIERGLPPDDERNLLAAGIDPREFRSADPERQAELRGQSSAAIASHGKLLGAVRREGSGDPTPREQRAAARELPRQELRRVRSTERVRASHDRRKRRNRQRLYRR